MPEPAQAPSLAQQDVCTVILFETPLTDITAEQLTTCLVSIQPLADDRSSTSQQGALVHAAISEPHLEVVKQLRGLALAGGVHDLKELAGQLEGGCLKVDAAGGVAQHEAKVYVDDVPLQEKRKLTQCRGDAQHEATI